MMSQMSGDRGFTLVEILAVTLIIGILTSVAVATYVVSTERAQRIACQSNRRVFEGAIETYRSDHDGAAPAVIEDLSGYVGSFDRTVLCPADSSTSLRLIIDPQPGITCDYHQNSP